ncbi:MAG: GDSL-type esterase/lipase family protein [Ignavibacteriales bacterium]|nr:GDSL-type esterase/lipase family protein [Ignavibacteriales bacterium]
MTLNKKQIYFTEKKRRKFSAEEISKKLNIPIEEIKQYLNSHPVQQTPFYFYIILISIPILFFILLEVGLRIFSYGIDLSMWVNPINGKMMLNPDVAHRYFSTVKNVPTSIEDIFDSEKAPNAFRVFILGESSAAGYPYMPLGSFSRYIRKRLEIVYPNTKIEVINLGLTAVNSYTVRDFIPGVLQQKPDLILIYTGHNEYYGALGVGSIESFGTSRTFVNLVLNLNKFKTTQLLRDFIQWSEKIFSSEQTAKTGTLMSRMAKDQTITLESDNYKIGLEQFQDNMRDVIKMAKDADVPIILGTLTSNLKDQKPFISLKIDKFPLAENVFFEARSAYSSGNYKRADSLFRFAKDLDGLRFRAPEKINQIIRRFGSEFDVPIVDVDSAFNAESLNGIVGDNLMTDHLHPTLQGYELMGKVFFEMMKKENDLPKNSAAAIPYEKQDSTTIAQFPFSKMDSTIAVYRIKLLKNDWPYIDSRNKIPDSQLLDQKTFEDSLAYKCVTKGISWIDCHQELADKYLREKNVDGFLQHIEILIYQYPIVVEYYDFIDKLGLDLIKDKEFDKAYKVFLKRYQIKPNDISTKWLGTIDLNFSRISAAIKYLEESVRFNKADTQTLYNLAGAYALNKDYKKSFDTITRVLNSDPNYPGAQNLMQQLRSHLEK